MKFLQERDFRQTLTVFGVDDAIIGGAAIGAGGNIFSSIFGSSAAKQQAEAIKYAANKAADTTLELNARAREDVAPFRQFGIKAGNTLADMLFGGKNMDDFLKASSLFKFQEDLGSRNLNRELKARGLYGSGSGLEALARFENQLVAEEGARTYDRLANLTTMGANVASGMASGTTQAGISAGNQILQGGIQQGAALVDAGRSIAQIGPGIAGSIRGGIGDYLSYQMYKPIMDRMAGTTAFAPSAPTNVSTFTAG